MAEIYGNTTTTPINPDAFADGGSGIIDLTYNPESENAQSGIAVADAIKGLKGDKGDKGDKGEPGEDGKDYVLTVEDKQEIAAVVAETELNSVNAVLDQILASQASYLGGGDE